jgi:hypothetical protein
LDARPAGQRRMKKGIASCLPPVRPCARDDYSPHGPSPHLPCDVAPSSRIRCLSHEQYRNPWHGSQRWISIQQRDSLSACTKPPFRQLALPQFQRPDHPPPSIHPSTGNNAASTPLALSSLSPAPAFSPRRPSQSSRKRPPTASCLQPRRRSARTSVGADAIELSSLTRAVLDASA